MAVNAVAYLVIQARLPFERAHDAGDTLMLGPHRQAGHDRREPQEAAHA